ncbi:hypothetical protein [Marinagarivorans algicola]|uniref:hypothetical protein n=1 Tax=Marinagarivorans algicola TaxID=1513270 RepID=UPI0012E0FA9C|nr:hypothetical protein [Marinagarivorans algicola]
MENQIMYGFDTSQIADRFLNRLKAGAVKGVRVRRYKNGTSILVSYDIPVDATFNNTCQQLDDLAEDLGGYEIL